MYRSALQRRAGLERERTAYAQVLASVLARKKPVIYMDETTMNTFCRKNKSWGYGDQPIEVVINAKRLSLTLFAAIGHALRAPVYMIAKKTCKEEFRKFLVKIRSNLAHPYSREKPYLVLDNARAHHALLVRDELHKYFRPLFMPSCSCAFNSAEHVFSAVKAHYLKLLLQTPLQSIEQSRFEEIVLQATSLVSQ